MNEKINEKGHGKGKGRKKRSGPNRPMKGPLTTVREWRPENGRGKILLFVACSLIMIASIFMTRSSIDGPDAPYHYRISQLILERGLPRALPQIEHVEWANRYVDKEFFYHVLTAASFAVAGEKGVDGLTYLLAFGILGVFLSMLFSLQKRHPHLDRWFCLLLMGAFLLQSTFIYRISMVRPHVLAILIFILNLKGILERKHLLMIATSFLLPLSYHMSFLIPLNLVAAWIFLPDLRKMILFSCAAFALGLLVNPYFPDNLWAFIVPLQSGLGVKEIPRWLIPSEFRHPSFPLGWPLYFLYTSFLALGIWQFSSLKKLPAEEKGPIFFLGGLFIIWLLGFAKNYRAVEYSYPIAFLLVSFLIASFPALRGKANILFIVAIVGALEVVMVISPRDGSQRIIDYVRRGKEVILQIPDQKPYPLRRSKARPKVFNCSWAHGNSIFHYKPQMGLIDLLDPTYLYNYDNRRYQLRQDLSTGAVSDAYEVVGKEFGADYFLCEIGLVNFQLEFDPRFRRIVPDLIRFSFSMAEPNVGNGELALFEVVHEAERVFVPVPELKTESTASCASWETPVKNGIVMIGLGGTWRPQVKAGTQILMVEKDPTMNQAVVAELLPLSAPLSGALHLNLCSKMLPDGNSRNQAMKKVKLSLWTEEDILLNCEIKKSVPKAFKEAQFVRQLQGVYPFQSLNVCQEAKTFCEQTTPQPTWCQKVVRF